MSQSEGEPRVSYELQCVKLKHHIRSFLSVVQLINERYEVDDVDLFLLQVDQALKRLEDETLAAGLDSDQFDAIRYALCACFDECLLDAGGVRIRERLQSCSLQARYSNDYLAGEGFFERLDRARIDVRQNRHVLEVYLLCMTLGFKGRYLERGPQERLQFIEELQREMELDRSGRSRLSPGPVKPGQDNGFSRTKKVPAWVNNILLLSVAVALWCASSQALDRQSQVLIEHIEQRWGD